MKRAFGITFPQTARRAFLLAGIMTLTLLVGAYPAYSKTPDSEVLRPGEVLTYDVSWSRMVSAGSAVMEIREGARENGRETLDLVLTGRSRGVVDKLFPVNDRVTSVFDPDRLCSTSYDITESFGTKKRHKSLLFDRVHNTVILHADNDQPQTIAVPPQTQDGLSSLYYLRTRKDFVVGKAFAVDVHDSGKNWSLEVLTLGRERIRTPAGEFDTLVVRTRPLYEGVYQNKGEVFIWLTDDSLKVPVLMKSTIKVGSFVFTLVDRKPGAYEPAQAGDQIAAATRAEAPEPR